MNVSGLQNVLWEEESLQFSYNHVCCYFCCVSEYICVCEGVRCGGFKGFRVAFLFLICCQSFHKKRI